jgi:hypothetical protein
MRYWRGFRRSAAATRSDSGAKPLISADLHGQLQSKKSGSSSKDGFGETAVTLRGSAPELNPIPILEARLSPLNNPALSVKRFPRSDRDPRTWIFTKFLDPPKFQMFTTTAPFTLIDRTADGHFFLRLGLPA